MDNVTPEKKLIKARTNLLFDAPFYGAVALRMPLKADATCETAYTDGRVIGYNPAFIDTLSLAECKGLIAHEAAHVLLAHHLRRGKRDVPRWNVACDKSINDHLIENKLTLPPGALRGDGADKSAEQWYGSAPEEDAGDQGDSPDGQGQKNDPGGCGEIRDFPGENGQPASPAEKAAEEADLKVRAAQAMQRAKAMGKMPGGMARIIEDMLNPKIDWQGVLKRFIDSTAKNDYTWCPPNRRHVHAGIYLPAPHSNALKRIVVAMDTCGSIDQTMLKEMGSEIGAAAAAYQSAVQVIYCDAEINDIEEFEPGQDIDLHPKGGGGTDFRPPFAHVCNEAIPACMIYATDGECNRFPDDPGFPVLWVITEGGDKSFAPPFGEVLHVN